MSTTRKFFSGDSIEQAVLQAARHHGIEPEEVAYSVIEKRHGFLKVRRRVLIEVPPDAPRKDDEQRASAPAPPREEPPAPPPQLAVPSRPLEPRAPESVEKPASSPEGSKESDAVADWRSVEPAPRKEPPAAEPEAAAPTSAPDEPVRFHEISGSERPRPLAPLEEPLETIEPPESAAPAAAEEPDAPPVAAGKMTEAAYKGLDRIFELGDLRLEAKVAEGAEGLEVELQGDDQDLLLRDRGRLLLAIQHLLPRLLRGFTGESAPVKVDSDNFHEIREEQLRDMAQRAASEVHQEGRARTLEPMSPDERRIVHMTLTDDAGVTTESKGQGFFKRITVRPKRGG